ncbi:GxGYxYP domain-containing protein [Parapedobacter soli]|uniref:GxGYxYP domain-containing protein n=1 Tax=Parapedobacter soli TaxID=416955 RepID=UPI0021CA4BC4|nr:GxGYxYP domain-containing protein [Parapedobacter soli]
MKQSSCLAFLALCAGFISQLTACQFNGNKERNNDSEPQNAELVKDTVVTFDMQYLNNLNVNNEEDIHTIWEHVHTAATLQGIVNRSSPRLYLFYVEVPDKGINVDRYWWDKYRQPSKWLGNANVDSALNIIDLVTKFNEDINGAVVYDPNVPATSNLASSIAGAEDLVAVCYNSSPNSLYSKLILEGPKIPVKVRLVNEDGSSIFDGSGRGGTPKTDAYRWFIDNYMETGKCNPEYGAYYIDQYWRRTPDVAPVNHHTLSNHDFFVSKKGYFFDLSPWADEPATDDRGQSPGADLALLKEMLMLAYEQNGNGSTFSYIGGFPAWRFKYTVLDGGRHGAVESEWEFMRVISAYNAFVDADATGGDSFGALANGSFWQHYPLKSEYPQEWVSARELSKQGYLDEHGKLSLGDKKLLIFYAGDYDASSWLSTTTPYIWDDPNRGIVPIMWAISPILSQRVPMALDYRRETATPNDYFVAADNGAGYLNPGMLQAPRPISGLPDATQAWANHNIPYYQKWGLSVSGFVIDGYAPGLNESGLNSYAAFSPNGIVRQNIESYTPFFEGREIENRVPRTYLHGNVPILREGGYVNSEPEEDAAAVVKMVNESPIPFFWVRSVLKSPTWYGSIVDEIKKRDPNITLVDAPTFFELYRIYLKENEDAAKGQIK